MPQTPGKVYDDIYSQPYEATGFAYKSDPTQHPFYKRLKRFVDDYDLGKDKCLEIGSGRGPFQNLVSDYYGMDVSSVVGKYYAKPYSVADAQFLPYPDESFGAIWTTHVLEHIPDPEFALNEMWRVLKPGGYLFVSATWQVGPWQAEAYQIRPYSDFGWKGKLIKASVPIRDSVLYRSLKIFPKRLLRILSHQFNPQPSTLDYRQLYPNRERYVGPDSSAEVSIEPFEVWFWYRSRGAECLNYPNLAKGFLIRTGSLTFRKPHS